MTTTEFKIHYRELTMAINAMRDNFMAGDLSGFESPEALHEGIRATERQRFELQRYFNKEMT